MYRDKLYLIIVVLTISLILIHTIYNSQFANFFMDDYWWGMYTGFNFHEKLFDSFRFDVVHGGGYLGLFLCKFFSFGLPSILNIHPQDFVSVPHGIIRSFFAVFILYLISGIFIKNSKTKPYYYFLFPFCTLYYLYAIYSSKSVYIDYSTIVYVNYNWYRYFFSLLFFVIFWKYICENILSQESKNNYIWLVLAVISGYIIGTSSEIIFGSSIIAVLLIICSKFVLHSKIYLNVKFYLPVLALFISSILFTASDKFNVVLTDRISNNLDFSMFYHFLLKFFEICFLHELFYWILFIIISIMAVRYSIKYRESEKLLVAFFILISTLIMMFSLSLLGSTYSHQQVFWLEHHNIQFLYKMLILFPLLMLFDYISKRYDNYCDLITGAGVSLFVLFLALIQSTDGLNILRYRADDIKLRTQYYVNEKIINYYYLLDEKPDIVSFPIAQGLQYYSPVEDENQEGCYIDYILSDVYYSKIYKNNKPITIGYCKKDVKTALEEFYKNGGNFSHKELKELKFNNLKNKEFVFTKQRNEIPIEKLQNIIE